ncbi:hypothetical protein [Aeromonas salmonicida]|uniref:hypothetical protein n=1 Tax=Aeromonas salmonicida TaxID=645 RepID=UPI0031FBC8A4
MSGDNYICTDCIVSEHRCRYKFSEGDRIKFCKNDYRLQVSNGTFGTIKHVKYNDDCIDFGVDLDDGRYIAFNDLDYTNEDGRLPIALGYALTVYASQGTTIDGDVLYTGRVVWIEQIAMLQEVAIKIIVIGFLMLKK